MANPTGNPPKPRKIPRQARATATVEAIFTATIQVLLEVGSLQLTTTRVAERAGVSVGTLYQYFPDKRALLFTLVQRHLEAVAQAMELVSKRLDGERLAVISDGLVSAWLAAKTKDVAVSRALYVVATEFDSAELLSQRSQRIQTAIRQLLIGAADADFEDPDAIAYTLRALLGGSVRFVLERHATTRSLAVVRRELPLVCHSYLVASAMPIATANRWPLQ